jgi:aspartate/methionine/tyrosine aminotransferase
VDRGPENVLVTAGGIEAVNVISATFLNPGDEALIPDPEYSAYADSVSLFGGTPVFVPLKEDFHLDFEAMEKRISPKTKIVFISSPGNPTGRVLREEEIQRLAQLAVKMDFLLVLDEAYHKLIYRGIQFRSICQIADVRNRSILLNSFSKTYAMTGWRVGYMVADAPLIKDMVIFHKATTICPNVPAQMACAAAAAVPRIASRPCAGNTRTNGSGGKEIERDQKGSIRRPAKLFILPRYEHAWDSQQMTEYLFGKGIWRAAVLSSAPAEKHIRISLQHPWKLWKWDWTV